jgi:uncharacterized protein YjiS (DUF1127 family)
MRISMFLSRDAAGSSFFGAAALTLADLWRALRNRREVLRLTDLDDRALKDIGLLRSDVEGALLEPLHKDPSKFLAVRRVEHGVRARPAAVKDLSVPAKEIRFAPRHACCV